MTFANVEIDIQPILVQFKRLSYTQFKNKEQLIDDLVPLVHRFRCRVCFKNDIDRLLLPCHHVTLCHVCVECIHPKTCPICLEDFCEKIKVYL